MLVGQVSTGGVVSTTETCCVQASETFVQQSVACHAALQTVRHGPNTIAFVNSRVMITLVPQQASVAVGGSKTHAVLH